jgi:hypothetical protein
MSKPSRIALMTVLILALASVASAQPRTPPPNPSPVQNGMIGAELEAINFCLRQVRQRAPQNRFNAHVRPDGRLRMTGSEHDKAAFLRCMAEDRGFSFD